MSLGDALSIAMAGLRANQAAMSLVSSNVANAETPGYVRKTIDQVTTNSGSIGTGVRINGVNRQLDEYIQAQLRTETSGAGYAIAEIRTSCSSCKASTATRIPPARSKTPSTA